MLKIEEDEGYKSVMRNDCICNYGLLESCLHFTWIALRLLQTQHRHAWKNVLGEGCFERRYTQITGRTASKSHFLPFE